MKGFRNVKVQWEQKAMKVETQLRDMVFNFSTLVKDKSGDQMTGWLIVVLLVVVTGAVFLALYQSSIQDIWQGIINKMKTVFGI